ncbi:YbgC/FadM family acyl-CoA thioesterase [Sphingomonas sp.]|jgi:acyl-CoA thioester hydrolase|uniref:YbgC/FadM family acyl-CoA thioesterase n=1 Tax=Sphingomonas sp. TaxID=28214 RepID=UPI002DB5975E|nr:YbgC/FadM family acyl-CoA thioesterase [Sphingomonas sp.]HEU4967626.1 YbgC/FadM family acyl-CoA thioesterase [Sphingomonas sp.]
MTLDQPQRGRLVGREHRFPVRVFFEDTDLSGVVYHANYLRYMERARSDMLSVAGIDQRAAFDAGEGYYVVADLSIRYRRPARLDDALVVVTTIKGFTAASATIHQRVMLDREVLTEAEVLAAFVAPVSGRPRRQPREWLAVFERLLEDE